MGLKTCGCNLTLSIKRNPEHYISTELGPLDPFHLVLHPKTDQNSPHRFVRTGRSSVVLVLK